VLPRSHPIVVISGAGGELGRVLAKAFAEGGARLALLDVSSGFARAQAHARTLKTETLALRCDLRREGDVKRAFRSVRQRWGRADILINNAAVEGPTRPAEQISLVEWEDTLRVNLTAAFLCARECVALMRPHSGSIIQIGSVAGRIAYKLRLPYAVSKAALQALTRGLAVELGQYGIRVNLVAPGPITGARMNRIIRTRAHAAGLDEGSVRRAYLSASILGKMVKAEDVARLVLFLCSPAGAHITGEVLEVSAGWRAEAF
jgi:NAD(P)-dependent dehydrogenase (short-subunit alcohol dehydrogenase family)